MSKKTVNVVALKDDWILQEIAQHVSKLPYVEWTTKPTKKAQITYYINYAQSADQRVSPIECALFTHVEYGVPALMEKWRLVGEQADVAVCMSKPFTKEFRRSHAQPVVISPGVDMEAYSLKKIRIGVIGSAKKTGRKGERIIAKVMDIPEIEWCFTGKGWPGKSTYYAAEDMPAFYHTLDYVLIASDYEGGPMCAIEALACGVPLISTDVGWVGDLPHIKIAKDSEASLRRVLMKIVEERKKLRQAVLHQSWDNYTKQHDVLFQALLKLGDDVSPRSVKKALKQAARQF